MDHILTFFVGDADASTELRSQLLNISSPSEICTINLTTEPRKNEILSKFHLINRGCRSAFKNPLIKTIIVSDYPDTRESKDPLPEALYQHVMAPTRPDVRIIVFSPTIPCTDLSSRFRMNVFELGLDPKNKRPLKP